MLARTQDTEKSSWVTDALGVARLGQVSCQFRSVVEMRATDSTLLGFSAPKRSFSFNSTLTVELSSSSCVFLSLVAHDEHVRRACCDVDGENNRTTMQVHQREDISEQATRHGSVFSGYDMSGLAFR